MPFDQPAVRYFVARSTATRVHNFEALFSATCTINLLIVQIFTLTKEYCQIEPALRGLHRRLENLGTGDPDVAYTDNTADRGMLEGTFTGLAAGLTPLPTENPDGLVNASMVGIYLNIASDLRSAKVNADIALSELTVHLNTAPADEPFVVSMDTEWDTGDNYAKLRSPQYRSQRRTTASKCTS